MRDNSIIGHKITQLQDIAGYTNVAIDDLQNTVASICSQTKVSETLSPPDIVDAPTESQLTRILEDLVEQYSKILLRMHSITNQIEL